MAEALVAVAILGQVGGSLLEAKSAVEEGEAYAKAAQYNARASLEEGYGEELKRRRLGAQELGRERVAYAKAGVRTDVGSPLDVLASNAAEIERGALEARLAGLSQARLSHWSAEEAIRGARKKSYAALLSGGAKAAGTGYTMGFGG